MSPFLSGSGTSNQRTRMLLEVVAKADTLVGPQEGTGEQRARRQKHYAWIDRCLPFILCVYVYLLCTRWHTTDVRTGLEWSADVLIMCVCIKLLLCWYTLQACWEEKQPFSSLALIPGRKALIPENLLRWVVKKSARVLHSNPCYSKSGKKREIRRRAGRKRVDASVGEGLLRTCMNLAYGEVSTANVSMLLLKAADFPHRCWKKKGKQSGCFH